VSPGAEQVEVAAPAAPAEELEALDAGTLTALAWRELLRLLEMGGALAKPQSS
jgi:hypothetical protein